MMSDYFLCLPSRSFFTQKEALSNYNIKKNMKKNVKQNSLTAVKKEVMVPPNVASPVLAEIYIEDNQKKGLSPIVSVGCDIMYTYPTNIAYDYGRRN